VVGGDGQRTRLKRTSSDHLASLEQEFRSLLGTKVDVRATAAGRGRIIVHFKNHEEFERLQELLYGASHQAAATRVG
jgi:ParB family chromosome partitioning protein